MDRLPRRNPFGGLGLDAPDLRARPPVVHLHFLKPGANRFRRLVLSVCHRLACHRFSYLRRITCELPKSSAWDQVQSEQSQKSGGGKSIQFGAREGPEIHLYKPASC
jgi:hypothetical protein